MELMVATAVFSICSAALGTMFLFSIRSLAAMANYTILDKENRQALDELTREIRQARVISGYVTNTSGNSITLTNGDNKQVTFTFSALNRQLLRTADDGSSKVLLTNCSLLRFDLFQRNPSNGNYGVFPVAYSNWQKEVKVVQMTWKTVRTLPNGLANSENIQTARIVIRKQQQEF
jgi:Tfp pilus assembly protein PilW